jgi:hypothetical protein
MKVPLTPLLAAGARSDCVATTYIDPQRTQTWVLQGVPGIAETMALGILAGAVLAPGIV